MQPLNEKSFVLFSPICHKHQLYRFRWAFVGIACACLSIRAWFLPCCRTLVWLGVVTKWSDRSTSIRGGCECENSKPNSLQTLKMKFPSHSSIYTTRPTMNWFVLAQLYGRKSMWMQTSGQMARFAMENSAHLSLEYEANESWYPKANENNANWEAKKCLFQFYCGKQRGKKSQLRPLLLSSIAQIIADFIIIC